MRINMLEDISQQDILSQPYFDRFPNIRFYHGTRNATDEIQEVPFKLRTKPKDTNRFLHDAINELSTDQFGIPIRNLLFAYIDKRLGSIYGNVFVIIPKGDFKVYFHPDINDMTIDLDMNHKKSVLNDIIELALTDLENDELVNYLTKDEIDRWFHHVEHFIERKTVHHINAVIDDLLSTAEIPKDQYDTFDSYLKQKVEQYQPIVYMKLAEQYISDVKEITHENELNYNEEPELMIYAPNGFYAIPLEDYEDEYEI